MAPREDTRREADEASSSAGSNRTLAEPQSTIGSYALEGKIGAGGMGVVYLARHRGTGQRVALKVIVPESAASQAALQRFLREADVLRKLNHPRIVKFLELGLAGGQFYFAMEYVQTVDVNQVLSGRPEASRVKALCGVACQVLEALHYAHALSVVHRDIKPSNILVAQEGRRLRTRLADFGLAKNFQDAGLSGMTCEGQTLGTLAFMAPEQIMRARDARPAADLYSVAATLYFLLARRYPFDLDLDKDPLLTVLEESPAPLAQVLPGVSAHLASVIHRGLAKDPQQRFPSAEAMRQALLPLAKGGA
jgi:serine/threonine-protein kinase